MPTGYTADIKDGISFEQFVLNCAKGQMHEPAAQRYVKTMPGGFIA